MEPAAKGQDDKWLHYGKQMFYTFCVLIMCEDPEH